MFVDKVCSIPPYGRCAPIAARAHNPRVLREISLFPISMLRVDRSETDFLGGVDGANPQWACNSDKGQGLPGIRRTLSLACPGLGVRRKSAPPEPAQLCELFDLARDAPQQLAQLVRIPAMRERDAFSDRRVFGGALGKPGIRIGEVVEPA
jgi:hypothetical protein